MTSLRSTSEPVAPVAMAEIAAAASDGAMQLRAHLRDFLLGLQSGALRLHLPAPMDVARGEGHFHLAPELFLQVAGQTRFRLPQGERLLAPGEALLMPPRLLHDEQVSDGAYGEPFCNLVLYADGSQISCHVAHEAEPGRPGIRHLESRRNAKAARMHAWLVDACAGAEGRGERVDTVPAWASAQSRALVLAAVSGALGAFEQGDLAGPVESVLIARLRVLVQNQLGDHQLSVRRLADQSGCTADYLSHRFRHSTGEHLIGHITRLRMERAQRLLAETDLAGKEVAWACGFAAPSYFIRTFKAHQGLTPVLWRQQHVGRQGR